MLSIRIALGGLPLLLLSSLLPIVALTAFGIAGAVGATIGVVGVIRGLREEASIVSSVIGTFQGSLMVLLVGTDVRVFASESITVEASGAADVEVFGSPANVQVSESGAADVDLRG